MVQKTRAELEAELHQINQSLNTSQGQIKKHEDEYKEMEELKRSIESEIADLDAPKNPFLKVLSKLGTRANNVARNVKFSVMSEDQLKEEYVIYQRVSESLGKTVVSFEQFKEAPEDYAYQEQKPSLLKRFEDELTDGVSQTVETFNKASSTIQEKSTEFTEKAKPQFDKIQEKITATIEDSKNPESSVQKLKGKVLDSFEESKPLLQEFGRTFKLGASLLRSKINDVATAYAEAKQEVESTQEAAQKTTSTPAKKANTTKEKAVTDEKQATVIGTTEGKVERATPSDKAIKLSRRDQFLTYMDSVIVKSGKDVVTHANYKDYVKMAGEDAYKEANFKRFVKEFDTALNEVEPSVVAEAKKPAKKRTPKNA